MSWSLRHGDCLDLLKDIESNSIDSVVTDPPYGISFMGEAWDKENPGVEIWKEALRVLKPGGHAVVFAGTRTAHHMGVALELAGFEIRDMGKWLFWCVDEETEVLTDTGWMRYNESSAGRLALCFDVASGDFSWGPIENHPVFDFDGTAYRIVGDGTDQLVTGGHRVVIERDGEYGFAFAEDLAQKQEARVPVLEGLHALLECFFVPDAGAGSKKKDVFDALLRRAGEQGSAQDGSACRYMGEADVPGLRQELRTPTSLDQKDIAPQVLEAVQRETPRTIPGGSPQSRQGVSTAGSQRQASRQDARHQQSGVEGRGGHPEQEVAQGGVAAMPARVHQHGTDERLRPGAPAGGGASNREATDANRGRASHESRSVRQQAREPGTVQEQQGPQTVRGARHTRSVVVRVEPVAHRGKMWCIKVHTGAFVARRRGKVFVTGNSGFPKSLNISKAIDKMHGAEREPGPPYVTPRDGVEHVYGKNNGIVYGHYRGMTGSTTLPSTEDAKKWDGWGTYLKPAGENWFLVRKPLQEKTIAKQVLSTGTGALNIDACRYPLGDKAWPGPQFKKSRTNSRNQDSVIYGALGEQHVHQTSGQELGRFPANIYYCPKPSRKEKEAGCESLPAIPGFRAVKRKEGSAGVNNPRAGAGRTAKEIRNVHKTVKPIALMRWLVRLVTPTGGMCIDPFVGSGTTGIGCAMEGFDFIGMDLSQEYLDIAEARIKHWAAQAKDK